jgi:hypothetical protein
VHSSRGEVEATEAEHREAVRDELDRVLRGLVQRGAQVALLETPPPGEPAECAWGEGDDACNGPPYTVDYAPTKQLNQVLRQAAAAHPDRVLFVPTADLFCRPDGVCPASIDGQLLIRYDGTHLTSGFSRLVAPELVRRVETAGARLGAP